MSSYQKHKLRCPDRDCKTVFEVEAKSTPTVRQTNFTQCPRCGEEMKFPKAGNWSVRNDTRIAIGTW